MFKFGKSNDPSQTPELLAIPETEDLQFALSKAQRNWRTSVALPFRIPGVVVSFTIVVKCEMGTGLPSWTLYRTDLEGSPIIWTHKSNDVLLIHNLISLEFTAAREKAESSTASASPATTPAAAASMPANSDAPLAASQNPYLAQLQQSGKYGSDQQQKQTQAASGPENMPQQEHPFSQDPVLSQMSLKLSQEIKLTRTSVEWSLSRSDTGILTYSAFLYFFENECIRFNRGGLPFSILLFDVLRESSFGKAQLSSESMKEVGNRLRGLKRQLDLLAHFEEEGFVFILPHTDREGASHCVDRVKEALLYGESLLNDMDSSTIHFSWGIASMPENGTTPEEILLAAKTEKSRYLG